MMIIEREILDANILIVDDQEANISLLEQLLEETGYTAPDWYYLGCIAANPVFMDSYVHHYLAIGAEKTGTQTLDDAEDIRVRVVPLEELRRMLFNGEFQHPHTETGALRGLGRLGRGL